jgi:hypothetical protein
MSFDCLYYYGHKVLIVVNNFGIHPKCNTYIGPRNVPIASTYLFQLRSSPNFSLALKVPNHKGRNFWLIMEESFQTAGGMERQHFHLRLESKRNAQCSTDRDPFYATSTDLLASCAVLTSGFLYFELTLGD